jgi:DNA-binding protein
MVAKKAEEVKEVKETKRMDDNVVFVGQKPTMSYVLAVITQFSGSLKEVHLKARGRSISRAVDVAEIVKNRFLQDVKVHSIDIGTEEREVEQGNKINVSTIDINLLK